MAREFDPLGFDLLLQLLSDDSGASVENVDDEDRRQKATERYRLLWSKTDFFLERRGCLDHEDAADETICRVTSLLPVERERVKNIQAFCLGVARLINNSRARMRTGSDSVNQFKGSISTLIEDRVDCLTKLVQRLKCMLRAIGSPQNSILVANSFSPTAAAS